MHMFMSKNENHEVVHRLVSNIDILEVVLGLHRRLITSVLETSSQLSIQLVYSFFISLKS